MNRIVARWIWRDKRGKPHPCVRFDDGSEYVLEKRGRKTVLRPIGGE